MGVGVVSVDVRVSLFCGGLETWILKGSEDLYRQKGTIVA